MRTYSVRIDGELVTLEESRRTAEACVKIGRLTIYGRTALIAMEGVVELLSPGPVA
jgi:hypothetical protein